MQPRKWGVNQSRGFTSVGHYKTTWESLQPQQRFVQRFPGFRTHIRLPEPSVLPLVPLFGLSSPTSGIPIRSCQFLAESAS